ncbi:MAG: FkbM family methyltransferase [Cyanobacteriota bacterium]|jgi:hypothetical protein
MFLQQEYSSKNIIVKIDVEGAEFSVLLGMKNFLKIEKVSAVVIEITPKFLNRFGHTKEMIYSFMNDCGFTPTVQSTEWQYDEVFVR